MLLSAWMTFFPQLGSGECWSAVWKLDVMASMVLIAVFVVPVCLACSSCGNVTVIWLVVSSFVYRDALSS